MALTQISFEFDDAPAPKKELKLPRPKKEKPAPSPEPVEIDYTLKIKRGRKALKDAHLEADLIELPDNEVLNQKLYYPIGDVAAMFKLNPSLLRFWEKEFKILKPRKNGKGDRLFRPEDIRNIKLIHHLLRERKYTIEGAKEFLKNHKQAEEKFELINSLKRISGFLLELKSSL
jgi:DNA-binding transcriptional MerR regulator